MAVLYITDCGRLTRPQNGFVSTPNGTTYGQVASFTCQTGYRVNGGDSLQCTQSGTWNGTVPTCLPVGK